MLTYVNVCSAQAGDKRAQSNSKVAVAAWGKIGKILSSADSKSNRCFPAVDGGRLGGQVA
jgi:hypothetical protein